MNYDCKGHRVIDLDWLARDIDLSEIKCLLLSTNDFVILEPDDGKSNVDDMTKWMAQLNYVAGWCKDMTSNEYETWNIIDGCCFSFDEDEHRTLFMLQWVNM